MPAHNQKMSGVLTVQPPRLAALLTAGPITPGLSFVQRLFSSPHLNVSFEEMFALPAHIVDMVKRLEAICQHSKEILSGGVAYAAAPAPTRPQAASARPHTYEEIVAMLESFCKAITSVNQCAEVFNAAEEHPNSLLRLNEPEAPEKRVVEAWSNWIDSMEAEIAEQQLAYCRAREAIESERARRTSVSTVHRSDDAPPLAPPSSAPSTTGEHRPERRQAHASYAHGPAVAYFSDDASGSPKRALGDADAPMYHPPAKRIVADDAHDV